MKTFTEGDAGFTVIEHYAAYEAIAHRPFEFAQSAQVTGTHCGPRLDFHAGDGTRRLLDNDIRLGAVLVSKMEELGRRVVPAGLPSQFLIRKCFQEVAQQTSVCRQRFGVGAERPRTDDTFMRGVLAALLACGRGGILSLVSGSGGEIAFPAPKPDVTAMSRS